MRALITGAGGFAGGHLAALCRASGDEVVEASAGGGMIKVTMSGDLELKSVEIDPDAVDPEDVDMLQDMVMAAVNEVLRAAQERANSKLGGVTGGMGGLRLPGM